jgi:glutaredoxin
VKEFLRQRTIAFVERDITVDDTAIAELDKLGVMTTPVTVVDGEVIVGYDLPKLTAALGSETAGP